MLSNSSRHQKGISAEIASMLLYLLSLHRILHHRYKTKFGEIDFIAKRFRSIAFVEVKFVSGEVYEEIISGKQKSRIRRAAEYFLQCNPQFADYNLRFDAVIIKKGHMPLIIKNAF